MKHKWFLTMSIMMMVAMGLSACAGAATATLPPATQVPTTPATATVAPTAAPTTAPTTAGVTPTAQIPVTGQTPKCAFQTEPNATITFSGWGDSSEQSVYKAAIQRFKSVCPGVTVNYDPIPSNFQTKLKAEMAAGTAPDVFYVDDQLMNAFAPTGQLMPLNSLMQQAGVQSSSFIPQLLTIFTYKNQIYGLPKDWGTLGLIYLPEAFKAAGIPEPTNNWTYQDMINAAKIIHQKTKYNGFCQAADWARLAPWVFANGGDYTNANYTQPTLNTPQVENMVSEIEQMKKDGSLVTPSDVGASWCGEALGKQLVAMTLEGGWLVPFMNSTYPKVNWKAAEIPMGPVTRADVIFTNAIGINASTKYPKASAAFLFYLTSPQDQGAIEATGFAYSTHPSQIKDVVNPNDRQIAQGGLLKATKVGYWGPNSGKLETIITNAINRVYLGQQTVKQSFDQAQQQAQALLSGSGQ